MGVAKSYDPFCALTRWLGLSTHKPVPDMTYNVLGDVKPCSTHFKFQILYQYMDIGCQFCVTAASCQLSDGRLSVYGIDVASVSVRI